MNVNNNETAYETEARQSVSWINNLTSEKKNSCSTKLLVKITNLQLISGKWKKYQSQNLKFVFTANFQARILIEKYEILKHKIDKK